MDYHIPVMLLEVIKYLNVQIGKWYIDCNLGGGGHTKDILVAGGRVVGIDWDQDAIDYVKVKLSNFVESGQLIVVRDNFVNLKKIVQNCGLRNVSGVLFDLGLSSHQLVSNRGFSFTSESTLDMRMDQSLTVRALDLVNGLNQGELSELFSKWGEERFARKIAQKIVQQRSKQKINTTTELSNLIKSIIPFGKIHPATKVFQALRIAVNDELNNLSKVLPDAWEILDDRGRLVVISFHSLEDRIVKDFFKGKSLTDKPVYPTEEEVRKNPRARSAKLRVAEKG